MKAIIIDDPDNIKFSENLSKTFNKGKLCDIDNRICYIHSSDKSPREIAEEINNNYQDILNTKERKRDNNLLFINIEGIFGDKNRQKQSGAEILMWLRCKHYIANPVILFAFQSNCELLKENPEHLIINSKGSYYYRLPYDFRKIADKQFKGLEENDWDGLKKFLRPAFNIEQFRHQDANWWGVKCLWDVHKVVQEGNFLEDYPDEVNKRLSEINNCIADFCYGMGSKRINDFFVTEENKIKEKTKKLLTMIETINNDKTDAEAINEIIMNISYEINLFKFLDRNIFELDSKKLQLEEENRAREKSIDDLPILKQSLAEITHELSQQLISVKESFVQHCIPEISNGVRILQIDDEADNGWAKIFAFMIFKKVNGNFKILDINEEINKSNNVDDFAKQVVLKLKDVSNNFDLIFLDLRLFLKSDEVIGKSLKEISGYKVLEEIRGEYPGLPVIMTSASNKIWSYEEVMKLGVDAYWCKEGIDNNFSILESVDNYIKLLKIVKSISGDEFKKLRSYGENIKRVKEENLWWKKEINWKQKGASEINLQKFKIPIKSKVNPNLVYSILDDCFILYREFLQRILLNNYFNPFNEKAWVTPSLIIQHGAKIIEIIHNFEEYEKKIGTSFTRFRNKGVIEGIIITEQDVKKNEFSGCHYKKGGSKSKKFFIPTRNDSDAGFLFEMRNKVSHTSNVKTVDKEYLNDFMENLMNYLLNEKVSTQTFSKFTN